MEEKIDKIVLNRHSVRSYSSKKIEGEVLDKLQNCIKECNELSGLNIQLILNESRAFGESHYGSFTNCNNYIAIVGDKSDKYLEEKAGYFGEKIVLFAQKNGLNTCWVALTYKKSAVPIELKENEKLVIIAIGYGENQGSFHRTKKYDEISKTSEKDSPDWYKRGVEYAMLAPTAFNQQKFQLELTNEKKDGKSVVKITSKLGLYIRIDKGIAIYHFELGAGKNNFEWSENI